VIAITPHFYLPTAIKIDTPRQVKTADLIVKGKKPLEIPRSRPDTTSGCWATCAVAKPRRAEPAAPFTAGSA